MYVIQFYVVIVFRLVKQSTKPLGFLVFLSVFFNMGAYEKKIQTKSLLKVHNRFTPKIHAYF